MYTFILFCKILCITLTLLLDIQVPQDFHQLPWIAKFVKVFSRAVNIINPRNMCKGYGSHSVCLFVCLLSR